MKILQVGKSSQGHPYLGASKILGGAGKGIAEAMMKLQEPT